MKRAIITSLIVTILMPCMSQIPTEGLVGHWPFDGDALDASGNNLNGTVHGAVPATDREGIADAAYYFDGNSWVEVAHDPLIDFSRSESYSISVWFRMDSDYGSGSILEKWINSFDPMPYCLRVSGPANDKLNFSAGRYIGGLPQDSTTCNGAGISDEDMAIDPESFHHLVAVYQADQTDLYLNGELVNTGLVHMRSGDISNTTNLFIGRRGGSTNRYFKGIIDDLMIYDRAISPGEILELYGLDECEGILHDTIPVYDTIRYDITIQEPFQGLPSDRLLSWYPFDGNASDHGLANNDGVVHGAVLSTDREGTENSAYYFDGVDDYILIPDTLPITNTFTIAFWALNENESQSTVICDGSKNSGGNDFLMHLKGNSIGIRADKSGTPLNHENSIPAELQNQDLLNNWSHIAWTMEPGFSKVYKNGEEIARIDRSGTNQAYHDGYSVIGTRWVWTNPDHFFRGKLDEIRIYDLALDSSQIQTLYSGLSFEESFTDTLRTTIRDTITVRVYDTIPEIRTETITDTLLINAVLTAIGRQSITNTLKVYPVPARDYLYINTGDYSLMAGYRLRIINQMGAVVFETNVEDALYELDLNQWTGTGLYYLQLIDPESNLRDVRKIVLE